MEISCPHSSRQRGAAHLKTLWAEIQTQSGTSQWMCPQQLSPLQKPLLHPLIKFNMFPWQIVIFNYSLSHRSVNNVCFKVIWEWYTGIKYLKPWKIHENINTSKTSHTFPGMVNMLTDIDRDEINNSVLVSKITEYMQIFHRVKRKFI